MFDNKKLEERFWLFQFMSYVIFCWETLQIAKLFILDFIVCICAYLRLFKLIDIWLFIRIQKVNSSLPNLELKLSHLLSDEHVNMRIVSWEHTTFISIVNSKDYLKLSRGKRKVTLSIAEKHIEA